MARTYNTICVVLFIAMGGVAGQSNRTARSGSSPASDQRARAANVGANQSKGETPVSNKVIEILTIDVKPGKRDEFDRLYRSESLPLLRKWKFDVIAYGPSLHDANSYYVIRSFKSLEDRQQAEDAFYGSDDWRKGPREALLALVDHFAYTVVTADRLKQITKGL
jgi:hypothetical protein